MGSAKSIFKRVKEEGDMYLIMAFLLVYVFLLSGCATDKRIDVKKSQPVIYEQSRNTYQQEDYARNEKQDDLSQKSYIQPGKKKYVEQKQQLSVKQIQRGLKNANFYKGQIDGKMGPMTKEAIKRFQKARGLKADGFVGKTTSIELGKYLLTK